MKSRKIRLSVLSVVFMLATLSAWADADFVWRSSVLSGQWRAAVNWTDGQGATVSSFPSDAASDCTIFNSPASVTVDATTSVKSITANSDLTFDVSAGKTLTADYLWQTGGDLTLGGGTTSIGKSLVLGAADTKTTLTVKSPATAWFEVETNIVGVGVNGYAKLVFDGGSHKLSKNVEGVQYIGNGAGATGVVEIVNGARVVIPGYGGTPKCYPPAFVLGFSNGYGSVLIDGGSTFSTPQVEIRAGQIVVRDGTMSHTHNSAYNVSKGLLRVEKNGVVSHPNVRVGNGGTGRLEIAGGSVSSTTATHFPSGNTVASRAEVELTDGGTLSVKKLVGYNNVASGKNGWFDFSADNGTVMALSGATDFFEKIDEAKVGSGGLTIDSAGYAITVRQNLQKEGSGGAAVTLSGAGTVTWASPATTVDSLIVDTGCTMILASGVDATAYDTIVKGGATLSIPSDNVQPVLKGLTLGDATGVGTMSVDLGKSVELAGALSGRPAIAFTSEMQADTSYPVLVVSGEATEAEKSLWKTVSVSAGLPAGLVLSPTTTYDPASGKTTFSVMAVDDPYVGKTFVWEGGVSGDWSEKENWSDKVVPGDVCAVTFPAVAENREINLSEASFAASLEFLGTASYLLSGAGSLSLRGLIASEPSIITVAGGVQKIVVPMFNDGANDVTVASGAKLILSGAQTNGGTIKRGAGVLEVGDVPVSSTQSFRLEAGHLKFGNSAAAGQGTAYLHAPATLTISNANSNAATVGFDLGIDFTGSDSAVVDYCIEGEVEFPTWPTITSSAQTCAHYVKRGSGSLTMTNTQPGKGSPFTTRVGEGGVYSQDVPTLDENGCFDSSKGMPANVNLLEGRLVVRNRAAASIGVGGGSGFGIRVASPYLGGATNCELVLDHVDASAPTFSIGEYLTTENSTVRHIGIVMTNGTTSGQLTYTSTFGGMFFLRSKENAPEMSGEVKIVDGSSWRSVDKTAYFYPNRSPNHDSFVRYEVLANSEFRPSVLVISGRSRFDVDASFVGYPTDSKAMTIDSSDPYNWYDAVNNLDSWQSMEMNFRNGSTFACSGINIGPFLAGPALKLTFDDSSWTFGPDADVNMFFRQRAVSNAVVEVMGKGVEFVAAAGQSVRFSKAVTGAGGVAKSGAGTFTFAKQETGYGNVPTVCTGDDAYTLAYSGMTAVKEGTLVIENGAAPAGREFAVSAGATLNLGGATLNAIVGGSGSVANGILDMPVVRTKLSDDHLSSETCLMLSDTVSVDGIAQVDLGYTAENPLTKPYPQNVLIGRYAGASTGARRWKVVGFGVKDLRGKVVEANGELRLTVAPAGMVILLR